MSENRIDDLVEQIIIDHNNNELGKINIKQYILNKYPNMQDIELIKIIYTIGNKLAKEGFEIKMNIDKFDIVNFRNKEYKKYLEEINKLPLENTKELKNKAKVLSKELLDKCDYKTSLKDILRNLLKSEKYNQKEEAFIRINIINNLTDMGYIIDTIDPLKFKKI